MKKNKLICIGIIIILLFCTVTSVYILKCFNKISVSSDEKFTLKLYKTTLVTVDEQEFKVKLTNIHNNTCPKDAYCQVDYFTVDLRINNIPYSLGSGYGTNLPSSYNIKGTNYVITLDTKFNKSKAVFTIAKKRDNLKGDAISYTINNTMSNYDSKYSERGVYYDTLNTPGAPSFYTIAMGLHNTGGYYITIEEVNIDEFNNVVVIVRDNKPSPNEIVTQAITYPICQLTLDNLPNTIIFKNTDGQIFKHINF